MDRREEIIWPILKKPEYCVDDNIPIAAIKEAMDEYMKECVLLALEFIAHETTGHSFNKTKDELEFKYNGEWISKEQLFENFL